MPVIVRYVNDTSEIQESFLAFVECEHGTSGEQVATLIDNTCLRLGLDLRQCRGQGFDGASYMAGAVNGAASRIRSKFPKALYFHCASHKLKCVARSCQITSVSNMMDAISCLANFFNYSPKRQKCLEAHVMNYREESTKTKLIPLCRTRWVERLNALEVTLDLAQAVSETFTDMVENSGSWNRDCESSFSPAEAS